MNDGKTCKLLAVLALAFGLAISSASAKDAPRPSPAKTKALAVANAPAVKATSITSSGTTDANSSLGLVNENDQLVQNITADTDALTKLLKDVNLTRNLDLKERGLYIEAANDRPLMGKLRSKIILNQLKALKMLVDNKIPAGVPPSPKSVGFVSSRPGEPGYAAEVAQHDREMAERTRQDLIADLINLRNRVTEEILAYYSGPPYNTREFERLTDDVLKNEKVAADLKAKLKALLDERIDDVNIPDNQMEDN